MTALKLIISGYSGRMGTRIAQLAAQDRNLKIAAGLEAPGHEHLGRDLGRIINREPLGVPLTIDPDAAFRKGDVVIEFTAPSVTLQHLAVARTLRRPMVIGTTGFTSAQRRQLQRAARVIPIVFSPNMSLGVNVLFELARVAAERLGNDYDVEIIEAHHHHKKDAPSGTAKRLVEVVAAARGQRADQVPTHAIRAGDIIGDHTVVLAGPSERLELTHRAQSRDVFALGALQAARFVYRHKPGLFDMGDVLRSRSR